MGDEVRNMPLSPETVTVMARAFPICSAANAPGASINGRVRAAIKYLEKRFTAELLLKCKKHG
jgi:hypothetical protein